MSLNLRFAVSFIDLYICINVSTNVYIYMCANES